jgi:hypothetical protein
LEHLPSAAFSTAKRRAASKRKASKADPEQPELPFSFRGGKAGEAPRHLNPRTVHGIFGGARQAR